MKQACHMKQPPSMVVVVEGEEVMPRVQISTSEDKLMACMTLGSMDRSSRSFWFLEGRICSKVLMASSYVCCRGDPPLECICQGIPPLESHIALSLAATAGKVIQCKGVFLHSNLPILILSPLLSLSLWLSLTFEFFKIPIFWQTISYNAMMSWRHVFKWNFYCWFQLVWALKNLHKHHEHDQLRIASSSTQLSLWKLGSQLHKCALFWDEIQWGIHSEVVWSGVFPK